MPHRRARAGPVNLAGTRRMTALRLFASLLVLAIASTTLAADKFKLKPGARGKRCVECHDEFDETLAKPVVHKPITEGNCAACHNPHTSNHEMLLSAESGEMCLECHDDLAPQETMSVHEVFVDGKCLSCHAPHAADNKKLLVRAGSELCFECHDEIGEKLEENEFQHEPVTEDCLECHNPHASSDGKKLLKGGQPALCLECHKAGKPAFKKAHKGYPVDKARCSACHDPHGSNTAGILFDNVHEPVLKKKCQECHEGLGSSTPFALKETGFELCEGCHYEEVADIFTKKRIHWPVVDETGCLNCHAPHASSQDSLLKEPMLDLCGQCHADTIARQERSPTEHPPIAEGECAECHSPHSSDSLFLANEGSLLELCESCHDWQAHSTHPIGEKIVDSRNQNVTVQCSSCHRSHGTEFEHFIYFETPNEMCVQCHDEYKR